MKYRSEIDGLRAVAVVPAVLFHAGFEAFSGGFVGVDVFFVLSGYLITSIILGDLNDGTFNVVLINPIPEAGWRVPETLAKKALYGSGEGGELTTSYAVFARRNSDIHNLFDTLRHPNIFQVHPEKVLCNTVIEGRCLNASSGAILYYDDDHLSSAGASLVVREITPHVLKNNAGASLGESR